MHINDWLARRAQLTPNKVALVDAQDGARPITYAAWSRAVDRTARVLRDDLAVQQGDRVAILAMNCVEYLNLWFACGKLGAILQALNWRLTPSELAGLIDDATPRALIYGPDFAAQASALRARNGLAPVRSIPLSTLQSLCASAPDEPLPAASVDWNDPWVICYTGGTTGLPKGALLTYRSITANSVNTVMSWGLTPDDVAILNAPLFHTGGLNVFTAPAEGTVLLAPHDERQSGQQELYLVLEGEVAFTLDGEELAATAGTVVAVPDPAVRRGAVARTAGARILAVGAKPVGGFRSTWSPHWFEHVPQF